MTTGERIKEYRLKKKLTQKELGSRIGLSESQIGQYERGYRNPKKETLKNIADQLDVNYLTLMLDSEEIESTTLDRFRARDLNHIKNKDVLDRNDKKNFNFFAFNELQLHQINTILFSTDYRLINPLDVYNKHNLPSNWASSIKAIDFIFDSHDDSGIYPIYEIDMNDLKVLQNTIVSYINFSMKELIESGTAKLKEEKDLSDPDEFMTFCDENNLNIS